MNSIRSLQKNYIKELKSLYSINEIKSVFSMVSSYLLGINSVKLIEINDNLISDFMVKSFISILNELKRGKPIQYILGEVNFYDCNIIVNQDVLIPRQETEELVEWLIEHSNSRKNILDVGTGSGCIAIAIAKKTNLDVLGLDISLKALQIAKLNAEKNNVNVNFFEFDILKDKYSGKKIDIIVSNPPYVLESMKEDLHKNIIDFEPSLALFVNNKNPLLFYEHIIAFAQKQLSNNGLLFFELNENFSQEVFTLLAQNRFINIVIKKDINGKDRMIKARIKY